MLNPPQSIADLVEYLCENPNVRCILPGWYSEERVFQRYDGGFWWLDPTNGRNKFTPMACSHTGSETCVTFTPVGFTIEKFDKVFHFHYLPNKEERRANNQAG